MRLLIRSDLFLFATLFFFWQSSIQFAWSFIASADGFTLDIPVPSGYEKASPEIEKGIKAGRRMMDSSSSMFTPLIRKGVPSTEDAAQYAIVIAPSALGHQTCTEEQFSLLVETMEANAAKGFEDFEAVTEENVSIGLKGVKTLSFSKSPRWYELRLETTVQSLLLGKSIRTRMYFVTGMVHIQNHVFMFTAGLPNATDEEKDGLNKLIHSWLGDLCEANNNRVSPKGAKQKPVASATDDIPSNLWGVGNIPSTGSGAFDQEQMEQLSGGKWKRCRTLQEEKARGLDVQFDYPESMECKPGHQPHIVYFISTPFIDRTSGVLTVAVQSAPTEYIALLKQLEEGDEKSPDFMKAIAESIPGAMRLISAGITRIEGTPSVWMTFVGKNERLGVSMASITRSFQIPASGGKILVLSFGVNRLMTDTVPVEDFKKFLPIGMRFVSSTTFLDKKQLNKEKAIEAYATGTAWFISQKELATCFHVVEGRSEYSFTAWDGMSVPLVVIAKDEFNDLAILRILDETYSSSAPLPFSRIPLKVTDKVFTVGYPVPSLMGQEAKYTEGVVSALSGIGGDRNFIQTTTPIQSGNSGGPLMNEQGEVVGVIQSKIGSEPLFPITDEQTQNVNYAVKIEHLRILADKVGVVPEALGVTTNATRHDAFNTARAATVLLQAR